MITDFHIRRLKNLIFDKSSLNNMHMNIICLHKKNISVTVSLICIRRVLNLNFGLEPGHLDLRFSCYSCLLGELNKLQATQHTRISFLSPQPPTARLTVISVTQEWIQMSLGRWGGTKVEHGTDLGLVLSCLGVIRLVRRGTSWHSVAK
jgi:hypothetical protein